MSRNMVKLWDPIYYTQAQPQVDYSILHTTCSAALTTTQQSTMDAAAIKSPSSKIAAIRDEDYLFQPPAELVCPITCDLFRDPVLTSAGHMYERQALLRYLGNSSGRAVDPVSRQPIDSSVLMPLVKIRGRAIEYREDVSRACVEMASNKDCSDPVKYLRRAAELCSEVDLQVPGLSADCIDQLGRLDGEEGSGTVLRKFAEGMLATGEQDKAAAVYYNLLRLCEVKEEQWELLEQCVKCWTASGEPSEEHTIEKLTNFVMNQDSFTWGQIIELLEKGNTSETLILKLCEKLLTVRSTEDDLQSFLKQKDVLMHYVMITSRLLMENQDFTQSEVQKILEWKKKMNKGREVVRSRSHQPISSLRERRKPFFLKKKFVASVCFCVASLAERPGVLLKLGRIVPLLFLVSGNQAL